MPPLSFILKLVVLLALFLGGVEGLFAQRKDTAPAPVVARNVSVRRGEAVNIPLGIHGVRGEQLEFIIRSQPKVGRLGRIANVDANSAVVTFSAPADAQPGEDVFTYAARGRDGVSAAGVVTVTIIAPPTLPPKIGAVHAVDFPDTVVGTTTSALLEISNRGGGVMEGELKVSAPWMVEGQARYRLAMSQKAEFRLLFRPNKIGRLSGEATLGPEPHRSIQLSGVALAPFGAEPEVLRLTAAPGSQTRRAVLKLTNRTEEAQKLKLTAGPRLLMDATIEVPPQGKVDAPIFAEATPAGGFEDILQITMGNWRQDVPVQAAPLGPMLRLTKDVRKFPAAVAGQRVEAIAVVKNSGGKDGQVRATVNAPFAIALADLVVPAGGEAEARIVAPGLAAGRYEAALLLEGEGLKEEVPFALEVAPKPAPVAAAPRISAEALAPKVTVARTAVVPASQALAVRQDRAPALQPRGSPKSAELADQTGRFVQSIEPEKVTLRWPASLGPATQLSVVRRQLSIDAEGELQVEWLPIAGVVLRTDTDPLTAVLPNLTPGELYTVRVRSQEEPVLTTQFTTPAKPPWISLGWQWLALAVLFLALTGLGVRLWKTRVRGGW